MFILFIVTLQYASDAFCWYKTQPESEDMSMAEQAVLELRASMAFVVSAFFKGCGGSSGGSGVSSRSPLNMRPHKPLFKMKRLQPFELQIMVRAASPVVWPMAYRKV